MYFWQYYAQSTAIIMLSNIVTYCINNLQTLRQNINQILNPQKTPHTSPKQVSYGVSFVNICEKVDCLNSLWPNDAIWRHRSRSTQAQVMAWCRQAPSHYLNQCWLTVSTDQWRLSMGNFTRDTPAIIHGNRLQFVWIKFLSNLLGANELKRHHTVLCSLSCLGFEQYG